MLPEKMMEGLICPTGDVVASLVYPRLELCIANSLVPDPWVLPMPMYDACSEKIQWGFLADCHGSRFTFLLDLIHVTAAIF